MNTERRNEISLYCHAVKRKEEGTKKNENTVARNKKEQKQLSTRRRYNNLSVSHQ